MQTVLKTSSPFSINPGASSEHFYTRLIQDLPVAVYTCDKNGYIRFYNATAAKLWGRTPRIGKDLWCGSLKLYTSDGMPITPNESPMAITLKEGKPVRGVEIIMERPDGSRVNVLPHPDLIYNEDGQVFGAVNTLVDITEHNQTKADNILLQHHNTELEQFAYAASHDMQEPLRKITTFTNLVLERNGEQLDDQGKNFISKISKSAERMSGIINDLLDYSRATYVSDQLAVTDLNEVLANVLSDLELLIINKNAEIIYDKLPLIKAIPSQINRLFYNLIQNALKFSKSDVPPVIRITVSEGLLFDKETPPYIEIKFADNGIGFDPKYSEKIFNLFQRLNEKQSYSGNGIGLSLCKKIAEIHHAQISADSAPGAGSVFTIKLPATMLVG